ncbi:hypothetical protein QBC43DRAFT_331714 [Cladorrhinum sp. PSN259]|nr:hypothetical protein QBC43DRAFT_331714 [Cladorrhinum sp. PSN259]
MSRSSSPERYMTVPMVYTYYGLLKAGSLEDIVDAIWNAILPVYFTRQEGYGTIPQGYVNRKHNLKRADLILRKVNHFSSKAEAIAIIESKGVDHESSTAVWTEALEQLNMYFVNLRAEERDAQERELFGIITVGHYSRFYVMKPHQRRCIDHPEAPSDKYGNPNRPLEFKKDEEEMMRMLLTIKRAVSPHSSPAGSSRGSSRPPSSRGSPMALDRPSSRGGTPGASSSRPQSRAGPAHPTTYSRPSSSHGNPPASSSRPGSSSGSRPGSSSSYRPSSSGSYR